MNEPEPSVLLEREDVGDVTVLRVKVAMLRGDATTDALFDQVYSMIEDEGRARLVLNLGEVQYLASMGIGKLVTLTRKVRPVGGRVVLCNVSRSIEELLRVARLSDLLLVYTEEQEAVRSFPKGG